MDNTYFFEKLAQAAIAYQRYPELPECSMEKLAYAAFAVQREYGGFEKNAISFRGFWHLFRHPRYSSIARRAAKASRKPDSVIRPIDRRVLRGGLLDQHDLHNQLRKNLIQQEIMQRRGNWGLLPENVRAKIKDGDFNSSEVTTYLQKCSSDMKKFVGDFEALYNAGIDLADKVTKGSDVITATMGTIPTDLEAIWSRLDALRTPEAIGKALRLRVTQPTSDFVQRLWLLRNKNIRNAWNTARTEGDIAFKQQVQDIYHSDLSVGDQFAVHTTARNIANDYDRYINSLDFLKRLQSGRAKGILPSKLRNDLSADFFLQFYGLPSTAPVVIPYRGARQTTDAIVNALGPIPAAPTASSSGWLQYILPWGHGWRGNLKRYGVYGGLGVAGTTTTALWPKSKAEPEAEASSSESVNGVTPAESEESINNNSQDSSVTSSTETVDKDTTTTPPVATTVPAAPKLENTLLSWPTITAATIALGGGGLLAYQAYQQKKKKKEQEERARRDRGQLDSTIV